jgi:malonyl-CoA decarboxylase
MSYRGAAGTERSPNRFPRPRGAHLGNRFDPAAAPLAALIDRRRELLEGLDQHPEWAEMEAELAELLKSRLTSEGLQLLRLDQRTPTHVLDQILKYETVHRVRNQRDLERRLAEDRRCYAFFHPALPDEPLIFTEVALTREMSSNVGALLDPDSPMVEPSTCSCAIFYSINSCHEGLRGVPLGNELIGQVTNELATAFPRLDTFATLSPVPGFRSWLTQLARLNPGSATNAMAAATLRSLERSDWYAGTETSAELKRQLVPLCAYYLLRVKRGDAAADPVARFHLRNGARLERINWLSDLSPAGLNRSAGLMANYVYRCTRPRREYDASTKVCTVQASRQVKLLAAHAASLIDHDLRNPERPEKLTA